ncbi:MAG: hypothetical protein DRN04_13125 [Thermoprotei archaeon]|nr:MAG: hypothetical protein DRN04_13125 [Thermoprotei archaeon]
MQRIFIEAVELCKKYGKVVALNRVSFISCARILALIGPNGADKTTFEKITSGCLRSASGCIEVLCLEEATVRKHLKVLLDLDVELSPDIIISQGRALKYWNEIVTPHSKLEKSN